MAISYTRTTWSTNDLVTSTKLNNIESQLVSLTNELTNPSEQLASTSKFGFIKISGSNLVIANGVLSVSNTPSFTSLTLTGNDGLSTKILKINYNNSTVASINNSTATFYTNTTITSSGLSTTALTATNLTASSLTITGALTADNSACSISKPTTISGALTLTGTVSANKTMNLSGTINATTIYADKVELNNQYTDQNQPTAKDVLTAGYLTTILSGISLSVGTGLSIDNGNLAQNNTITLSPATTSSIGGIRVGNNLTIDSNGILSGNYDIVTTEADGLMSSTDKDALDTLIAASSSYITDISSKADVANPSFTGTLTLGSTTLTEAQLQSLLATINT